MSTSPPSDRLNAPSYRSKSCLTLASIATAPSCSFDPFLARRRSMREFMDARPHCIRDQLERRERDGQGETARAGASRIEVEHAARGFDLRLMRMTRDDDVDAGGRGIEVELVEIVKHIE